MKDRRRPCSQVARYVFLAAILLLVSPACSPEQPVTPPPVSSTAPVADPAPAPERPWLEGEILPGKGMEDSLLAMDGFGITEALEVVNGLREHVDFRYLKAGQKIRIRMSPDGKRIDECVFYEDEVTLHHLKRDAETGKLAYSLERLPTERRLRILKGQIQTTLNQALKERGDVTDHLRGVVNGVLECLVSFRTHARTGDVYTVLVEDRMYNGHPVPPSKVLYAAYRGRRAGFHEAFYFDDGDPSSSWNGHYDEKGRLLVHSALRYPLDRIHVTSPFGMRRHPVTGKRSMHYGVDYRARVGTPVYAVAPGRVVERGRGRYEGKYVVIRHADGTRTYYLHLGRILVKRGQYVKAREWIARSGATGRVSAPHLHFGVKSPRGKWLNPLMQKMIAAQKLDRKRLARLKEQVADIRSQLADAYRNAPVIASATRMAEPALGPKPEGIVSP